MKIFDTRSLYEIKGGSVGNIQNIASGIYMFDDTYKGSRRLNITGHGAVGYIIGDGNVKLTGNDLRALFDQSGRNISLYKNIRTVACFSGDSPNPLAQQVADAFGLPTKGYRNTVLALMPEHLHIAGGFAEGPQLEHIEKRLKGELSYVYKTDDELEFIDNRFVSYHPVKFFPRGTSTRVEEFSFGHGVKGFLNSRTLRRNRF